MSSGRLKSSNEFIAWLNFLIIITSLLILAIGFLLRKDAYTDCERFLDTPLLVIGTCLMIFSVSGFIGALFGVPALLFIYLIFMFFLILVAVGITIFAFVVTNKGAGQFLSGKGYKEYRVGDYSHWLQKRVNNTGNWDKIKSCLVDSQICTDFYRIYSNNTTSEKFQKKPLHAIQSGCCKPSKECGFTYRSPSNWTEEKGVYENPDCGAWDNDERVLCFNCQSCKAGLLDNINNYWKSVALFNALCLGVLVFVYSVTCCAFRNMPT